MNRIVAVTIVGTLAAAPAFAECTKADRSALEEFDRAWGKATRSGDRAALEQVLADDYAGFGATIASKAQTIANAVRNAQAPSNQPAGDVREDFYQISCTPTTATIVHRNVITAGRDADERVTYSRSVHVVEKRGGKWQAVASTGHPLNDAATLGYLQLEFADAYRTADLAWFERNLAAGFSGIPTDGVLQGKDVFIAALRTRRSTYDSADVSEISTRVDGERAVVTAISQIKGRSGEGQPFDVRLRYTATYVKRDGRWQVWAIQATTVPVRSGT